METAHVIYYTEADNNGRHFADDMLKSFLKSIYLYFDSNRSNYSV